MLSVRFIRHGESSANAGEATGDDSAIPLTPRGHAQAQDVSQTFAESPALIITSPYQRARDTAAPTVALFPDVPLEVWPVHEFTYLDLTHLVRTTAEERIPWSIAFWERADPDHIDGPVAESYGQMIRRARAALERLSKLTVPSAAIFSHCTFMKAVHWEVQNWRGPITPETMRAFRAFIIADPIANTKGYTAHWNGRNWRVEA